MKRSWWSAFAVLAIALGIANGPRSWATPPALPDANQSQCSEVGDEPVQRRFSIELGITSKGVTLKPIEENSGNFLRLAGVGHCGLTSFSARVT